APGLQETHGMVPQLPQRPGVTSHVLRSLPPYRKPDAGDPKSGSAAPRITLHVGRERIFLEPRTSFCIARASREAICISREQRGVSSRLRSGRTEQLSVCRQLELARSNLVPD